MSAFSTLLALINAQIKTNGLKAITGAKLNGVLVQMVNELGSGYQFIDIATPATDPGTPDENVWYIASQAGTYTNFGGIIVNENEVCALVWNGSWTKKVTGAATAAQVNQLGQFIFADYKKTDFSINGFLTPTGEVDIIQDYKVTNLIPLVDSPVSIKACALFSNNWGGGVGFYDENKEFIESIYNVKTPTDLYLNSEYEILNIPNGARYIRVSMYDLSANEAFVEIKYKNQSISDAVGRLNESLGSLSNSVDELEDFCVFKLDYTDFVEENQFITKEGTIDALNGFSTTKFLPISGIKSCSVVALMNNQWGGGIAFYDRFFKFISSIYNTSGGSSGDTGNYPYTLDISDVPDGAAYMKVQSGYTSPTLPGVVYETDKYSWCEVLELGGIVENFLSGEKSTLSEGQSLEILNTPHTRNLYNIGVTMLVQTLGKIRISKGESLPYRSGKIEIDSTYLYVFDPDNPSAILETIPHGLTISDVLSVLICVGAKPSVGDNLYKADIVISSNSDDIFSTQIDWNGCNDNVKVTNVSGIYNNVSVFFGGDAFKKEIWICGDSYTGFWPQYAMQENAVNYMLDGNAGRGSIMALASLNNALILGRPKILIWAMGMNDGDGNSSVNSDWLSVFNSLNELCKRNNIQLIPVTIPNTPTIINYYKNEIVRNSGLKYIDLATLLGANTIGSSWFSGLLSSDNVHPTSRGSKLIANIILSQIPGMKD